MLQIVLGQDGDIVDDKINTFHLTDSDKIYSKERNEYILDFVGFVIEENKLLAVFPKHFFDDTEKNNRKEMEENIKLLFKVICKYNTETNTNARANKYIGNQANFESDYPFAAFFKVYEYYKKYGIYQEEEEVISKNTNGKISWKTTIQKSNVIVSNGNLIFLPLYYKKKNTRNVFISECMKFVINETIKNFSYFLQLQPTSDSEYKIDFLANREYTLRQLYQYRNTIFKDYQKELINALITFFEQYDKRKNGGAIHFKINYFHDIWESMVNQYLNDYFIKIDTENNQLIFDHIKQQRDKKFHKETFQIDISHNHFKIEPDHYLEDDANIYVFDSKYYESLTNLNYKQFSYTILLGNSQFGNSKNLYSALLLPGNQKSGLHLKLAAPYCQLNQGCNYIIEQFLSVKKLMENYIY